MGLREKARKSLQGGEREEAEELEAPVMPKVDIGKIEAEAKAREEQLRRELADSRKLSAAMDAPLAPQDAQLARLDPPGRPAEDARRAAARVVRQAGREVQQARAK